MMLAKHAGAVEAPSIACRVLHAIEKPVAARAGDILLSEPGAEDTLSVATSYYTPQRARHVALDRLFGEVWPAVECGAIRPLTNDDAFVIRPLTNDDAFALRCVRWLAP